ncbi:hypothetical protein Natpe_4303 (plasmid) [Natrinema pellirubrum DSM 15624]|uniref:Uncharacterized protein n=1 Tax=Natrinema pellirubrum (strain DSM 15624 / CIP 106293 / JCM 10476 / NCIMB 786 / 157) TaxID=797303 RepID=L0JRY5_NATP1|nr:hypothetical protein Natpe_4303 [Natrinema pellirubrum DSM 15624]
MNVDGPITRMNDDWTGEEVVAICSNCEAVYPAIRFSDGEIRRMGNLPYCRCGCGSFVEIKSE